MGTILRRGSLAALIALSAAQAAQAQEGIWVRCERAPGAPASDDGSFVGPMVFGTDTFRTYNEANRSFDYTDYCAPGPANTAECTLTDDEFTFDNRSFGAEVRGHPNYVEVSIGGRINRRTGSATFTITNVGIPGRGNHRYERVCRGTTDPRPPRAF